MKQYKSVTHTYRLVKEEASEMLKAKINGSPTAVEVARKLIGDQMETREQFWVIMLNHHSNTIGHYKVSEGGITATLVDIRLVLNAVIGCLATRVILTHNHPSGNTNPSESDKQLTSKMVKALQTIEVKVLDHVIVTKDSYYSFTDEGEL